MNDEPIRDDPDRAALVAQVAERIRTHPDPAMRARAAQIAIAHEDLQAIDHWKDPRGAVIAQDELRRWVRELAAAEDLADLKQAFCLGPAPQRPAQRGGTLVTRLTYSSADDPELTAVKRDITRCLDRIHTISVSWADITALPALDQQLIRQLPTGTICDDPATPVEGATR